jgi:hypothetical protein
MTNRFGFADFGQRSRGAVASRNERVAEFVEVHDVAHAENLVHTGHAARLY